MRRKVLIITLLSLIMFAATDCKLGLKISNVAKRFNTGKIITNTAKYWNRFSMIKHYGEKTKTVCAYYCQNLNKQFKLAKRNGITIVKRNTILKEAKRFRESCSPDLQFVSSYDVLTNRIMEQKLGLQPSAPILYSNMVKLGLPETIAKTEYDQFELQKTIFQRVNAHHIVSGNSPAAQKSREIFAKYGLDINDGRNGILLPNNKANFARGSKHGTSTVDYDNEVYDRIKYSTSQEDLVEALDEIKQDLYEGKLPILRNHEVID